MKKNLEIVYEYLWKESLASGKKMWKTDEIASSLSMQRSNVSTLLNELVADGRLEKSKGRPVLYSVAKQKEKDLEKKPFEDMVGFDGSLKRAVDHAKKSVMYPYESLNIQLVSSAGAGATTFGKNIYYYGLMKGRFGQNTPFIYVNCRHYKKNYNALNDTLFGDESGLEHSAFVRARGGVLFIDHVELLDAHQYSRVAAFLDSGRISSALSNQAEQINDLVFIFTMTSWDEEQSDWRNTTSIELPDLEKRPSAEKLNMIKHFFSVEAENAGCKIQVDVEAIRLLVLAHFQNGVKGILNTVKSACASAYIRVLDNKVEVMHVGAQDLPEELLTSIRPVAEVGAEIDSYFGTANYLIFGDSENDDTSEATEVYGQLKDQYQGMLDRGIASDTVRSIINSYLENLHFDIPKNIKGEINVNRGQLSQIVDPGLMNYVTMFADKYRHEYGRELSDSMFCGICLHINGILNKEPVDRKRIDNEQVKAVIQHYPREYATMLDFTYLLYERFYLRFTIEEIAILTMFIIDVDEKDSNPVLLYAMHGPAVATGLAEVANKTTGEDNVYALDLDIFDDAKETGAKLEEKIVQINRGSGVVVIYDSSSMEALFESISEKTNIKIRSMILPITSMGVAASRNCKLNTDIDKAFHNIKKTLNNAYIENKRPKAIITLCHTSEGGADQLKKYIDRYSQLGMPVFALAMSNKDRLVKEVMEIKKSYRIHAFVGTFDPEIFGIPFISIADVFECSKGDLDHVLMFETVQKKYLGYEKVIENYGKEAKYLTEDKLRKFVLPVVEKLAIAYELDEDERVGLCAHMIYMLDLLLAPDYRPRGTVNPEDMEANQSDYKLICSFLKPLEKNFHLLVTDEEVMILMRILRKQK